MSPREQERYLDLVEQMTPPKGDEIDGYPEIDCEVMHGGARMTVRYIVRSRWGQPEISGIFHGAYDVLEDLGKTPTWAYAAAAKDILAAQREQEESRAEMYEVDE